VTAAEYSIDFLGAQEVGMGAILMDLAGAYRDTPYPRVSRWRNSSPAWRTGSAFTFANVTSGFI